MEGGQKVDINLESPLDTKSSDMLVSVNDIKFAHNRQKYQGHVLPTSLRYERDGWAAGWYVYNFEIGGGYIFSTNETDAGYNSKAQWLAARRTKMNDTPTYVIDFHIANFDADDTAEHTRANIKQDANAVNQAVQFKAWYTAAPSIDARECKEVTINHDVNPLISVNYAVDGVDYKAKFRFNYDAAKPAQTSFTKIAETGWGANLSMEYLGHDDEGTVTARLTNNELSWKYSNTVYIPKDIIQNGKVIAKFVSKDNSNSEANSVNITWQIGKGKLCLRKFRMGWSIINPISPTLYQWAYYKDMTDSNPLITRAAAFIDEATGVSESDYSGTMPIVSNFDVQYTVPLSKFYYAGNNVVWSIQGTKTVFSDEDANDPSNKFELDTTYISHECTFFDGKVSEYGFDGPDFITNTSFSVPLNQFNDEQSSQYSHIVNTLSSIYEQLRNATIEQLNERYIPILTGTVDAFKMPGTSDVRSVTIQVYYKYPGHVNSTAMLSRFPFEHIGGPSASNFKFMPVVYPYSAMGITVNNSYTHELITVDSLFNYVKSFEYTLDGIYHANESVSSPNYKNVTEYALNKTYFAQRPIVGRKATFNATISAINGVSYPVDALQQINITSINANLNICQRRYNGDRHWLNSGTNVAASFNQNSTIADVYEANKVSMDLVPRIIEEDTYTTSSGDKYPRSTMKYLGTVFVDRGAIGSDVPTVNDQHIKIHNQMIDLPSVYSTPGTVECQIFMDKLGWYRGRVIIRNNGSVTWTSSLYKILNIADVLTISDGSGSYAEFYIPEPTGFYVRAPNDTESYFTGIMGKLYNRGNHNNYIGNFFLPLSMFVKLSSSGGFMISLKGMADTSSGDQNNDVRYVSYKDGGVRTHPSIDKYFKSAGGTLVIDIESLYLDLNNTLLYELPDANPICFGPSSFPEYDGDGIIKNTVLFNNGMIVAVGNRRAVGSNEVVHTDGLHYNVTGIFKSENVRPYRTVANLSTGINCIATHNYAAANNNVLPVYNDSTWHTQGVLTADPAFDIRNVTRFGISGTMLYIQDNTGRCYRFDDNDINEWFTCFTNTNVSNIIHLLKSAGAVFSFDIIDNTTGEKLVVHNTDVVTLNEADFGVGLNAQDRYIGSLLFPNVIDWHGINETDINNNVVNIQKLMSTALAYMPINKPGNFTQSIFSTSMANTYGSCQGIAIFNTLLNPNSALGTDVGKYALQLFSPLSCYNIAPMIQDDVLHLYTKKVYSHAILFDKDYLVQYKVADLQIDSTHTTNAPVYLLTEECTDLRAIKIEPRKTIFGNNNYDIETAGIYYSGKTLLEAASIAFYNNQVHITYQPRSGNSIMVSGVLKELSSSDISVVQTVDLVSINLPKYTSQDNMKYNFSISSDTEVPKFTNVTAMLNNINDTRYNFANVYLSSITFTNGTVSAATLTNKIFTTIDSSNQSEPGLVTTDSVSYSVNSDTFESSDIISDYSGITQLVFNKSISGPSDVLNLPYMPSKQYLYDTAFNQSIEDGCFIIKDTLNNNEVHYNYLTDKVTKMVIKGKQVSDSNLNIELVSDTGIAGNYYKIKINQLVNTLVHFKHVGIYKVNYKEFSDNTAELDSIVFSNGEYRFNVIKLLDTGAALSTAIRYNTPKAYSFNFGHFSDPSETTPKFLDYTATDVRDPNPVTQTKHFARVLASDEYQLIKQQWESTVEVENFWWVDSESILVLTKDKIILRKKGKFTEDAPDYDDWMGDSWYDAHVFNRTDYLTSDADTMLCSSATGKGVHSYLYTLCVETMHSIKVSVYDPTVVSNNKMHCQREYIIEFKHVALGQQLNDLTDIAGSFEANTSGCTVRTYSDIIASSLLTDSKLTAVEVNGYHWLGIQYDRNFNQWSFGISVDTANKCKFIHGYGCVGINGYATGGMIPAEYFGLPELPEGVTLDTVPQITGFIGTVLDVKNLEKSEDVTVESLSEFNLFDTRIVGDENQQWYICKKLKDIVMSVSLTDITNTVKLPITNTYAQVYSSPSYAKYTVHALGIQIKQLLDLLTGESKDNALWKEVIKAAMFPLVWYLSPYTNVINYLQQTLGQYAYVHYNSTSIGRRGSVDHNTVDDSNAGLSEDDISKSYMSTLISDDLSFDVQHITQEQSFKDNGWENVLGILASMVVSATDYAMQGLTVNQLQNQSAVSDIGRKFSQAFLQNVGSMSVTGFNMQSTKPMLKSEVTAVKTLDMFYSTSAQQNCYAGPGFVNMQFVAQCTAQSVTSVQLEAQQTQMFVLLRQLTTWQGKLSLLLLDMLKDFLFKSADVVAPNLAGTMPGVIAGLGWIAATVLAALGYATVAAQALLKMGIETVDEMLDSFFPNGIQTNVTAQLSRHNYDIEGKHAYGNKSETFMWPCVDCNAKLYTDESVDATLQDKSWPLEMPKATFGNSSTKTIYENQPDCITVKPAIMNNSDWDGEVPYSIAMCKGTQQHRALPNDTAYVIGTESFMPTVPFKNENIGEGEPVFTPPPVQDYQLNKDWNIFVTAMAGDALWVSCKDTKLFDGNYSNIVISDGFCGIAAPHVAVEVKRNICEEYLRPWAVSPDAIALNITGLNCAYEECAYHAFDGYGYRITDWLGSSGMNKEHYTQQYCFQINDRFKRSNKLPPNQFMGNFQAVPSMSLRVHDKVFNDIQVTTEGRGLRTGVTGENKDTQRYALPIFTEQISSLPAIVRALSPYKLAVIDGITSLTTDVRISQSSYKLPVSVDFNINDKIYRMTNEYICSVEHEKGLEVVKYLVPALGLTYLGATPFMAYFYNQATRQYYIYQGGNTLQVMDMLERFRDIKSGTYDFINQEIVMPCLATMSRLDSKVKDDADETDNIVIPVFRHNKVGGEITPPTEMIFNTRSWYRTVSTPAGLVFQGPNRCIINRFVWSQYMLEDIKSNKGKWIKVPREEYHPFRDYGDVHRYNNILKSCQSNIKGWTHNPFLLVTSPIGVNEETDCKFEWEITFAWTVEMEQIYADKEYVTVNVMAETMMPGGKKFSRPTHIYLHKELFTRTGNVGYYSFRYQSTNGAGNRERLHIWSDGYIAVSSLQLEYKIVTEKRNEMLITQEDLKGMKEM